MQQIGLNIIVTSMALVVCEGLSSYLLYENFFPSQVLARWGEKGIAFVAHGGMWGDLVFLPPIMAWIITQYGQKWSVRQVVIMGCIGFAITLANHVNLIHNQTIPDPIGWQKEKWNTVIGLHFVYMSTYVALAGLFFCYSRPSVEATVTVATLLGIHMAFGTHIPLGIANLWFNWDWCPITFLHQGALWMQVGIWLTLAAFSCVAAGWVAGLLVIAIGTILAALAYGVTILLCVIPQIPRC